MFIYIRRIIFCIRIEATKTHTIQTVSAWPSFLLVLGLIAISSKNGLLLGVIVWAHQVIVILSHLVDHVRNWLFIRLCLVFDRDLPYYLAQGMANVDLQHLHDLQAYREVTFLVLQIQISQLLPLHLVSLFLVLRLLILHLLHQRRLLRRRSSWSLRSPFRASARIVVIGILTAH